MRVLAAAVHRRGWRGPGALVVAGVRQGARPIEVGILTGWLRRGAGCRRILVRAHPFTLAAFIGAGTVLCPSRPSVPRGADGAPRANLHRKREVGLREPWQGSGVAGCVVPCSGSGRVPGARVLVGGSRLRHRGWLCRFRVFGPLPWASLNRPVPCSGERCPARRRSDPDVLDGHEW